MIRDYFRDRCLLVTGGTGFVGQALVAKIMRDLPEVRRIYLLIRSRHRADGRVVSAQERFEREYFEGSVFAAFRRTDPSGFEAARQKIVAVPGDITYPDLGLEKEIQAELRDQIDTIFHPAGSVVFDKPLDDALRHNTHGPLSVLELAQSCRQRVHLVHVSTAYVNGQWAGDIPEAPLPVDRSIAQILQGPGERGFDPEAEIADCDVYCQRLREEAVSKERTREFRRAILGQRRRRKLTHSRLQELVADRRERWVERRLVDEGMRRAREHGWSDVYSFTKGLGEQMLVKRRGDQPLTIVRPSIIESSLRDPEPGWITGLKVMDPLIAAYGRGMMPDFPAARDIALDLIPVDVVINAILAAAAQSTPDRVQVFHVATSSENPVTVFEIFNHVRSYLSSHPMLDRNGRAPKLPQWSYPSPRRFRLFFRLKYLFPVAVQEWVLRHLPDSMAPTVRRRYLATLKVRLHRALYYADLYQPYTNLRCRFETGRTRALFEQLPADEQAVFNLDVRRINWRRYMQEIHVPGLRRHVLREDATPEAVLPGAPEEAGAAEERWQAEEEIRTIPDLLDWASERYADNVAFQAKRQGAWIRYTYRQIKERSEAQASMWQEMGLQPGDRVLLQGDNSPEWVIAYLAASTLGLCVVPVDPQTPPAEIWRLVEFTRARGLIAPEASHRALAQAAAATPPDLLCLDLGNSGLAVGAPPSPPPRPVADWAAPRLTPDMTASIIFTEGALVEPRGVVLSHRNLIADLLALAEVQHLYESDRLLSLLPLHHGLEFTGSLLMAMLAGATTTYLEVLNSRSILEAMRETGTTALLAVPRLLKILLDRIRRLDRLPAAPMQDPGGARAAFAAHLRLVISGGAPLAAEIYDAYEQMALTVCEGYGLTEAAPVVTVNPPDAARRGSVGLPLPGVDVVIRDPDTEGNGEILVRGPNVMREYLDQSELTAEVLQDGWLLTGDIGYFDEDGYLYITGRSKDLIVTGAGKNVYPEEIEELYHSLPHVSELSVVGMWSPRTLGEEVHGIAVVDRPSSQLSDSEVAAQIRERTYEISRDLPPYQRIQHLHTWRRPLPRLDNGDVSRQALLAQLQLEQASQTQATEVDESLAPWERAVYQLISSITGLTVGEVVAHADAPLDALLDSLMTVEFAAELAAHVEAAGAAGQAPATAQARVSGSEHIPSGERLLSTMDRSIRNLRSVLDELRPVLSSSPSLEVSAARHGTSYWAQVLGVGETAATTEPPGIGPLARGLWALSGKPLRAYFSLAVEGAEHLPQDRPYLLAANHTSHLDGPAVLLAAGDRVDGMTLAAARDYFFTSSLRRWLFRKMMNAVPFDRHQHFPESFVQARAAMACRRPLLVFPEGTRSPSGRIMPYKAGIGLLALELGVPIVPVHIAGTYDALPKHGGHLRRRPVMVRFGPPTDMTPYRARREYLGTYELYREIVEDLQRRVEDLGDEGTPRDATTTHLDR